jgi:hypothetical protein
MELETAHQTIRSPSSQAPKFRDDQENDKHFGVRFFRQAIWFLSGKKRSGRSIKVARIGCTDGKHGCRCKDRPVI